MARPRGSKKTDTSEAGVIRHTVTEETLKDNPVLVEEGAKVGDVIEVASTDEGDDKLAEESQHSLSVESSFITDTSEAGVDPSVVKVLIKYPDDYSGRKYFRNGQVVECSKETADIFIKKGIATLNNAH